MERLTSLLLDDGESSRMIPQLTDAMRRHPLHESLARLLMLCLHREHRQAEALEVYHTPQKRLTEEMGAIRTRPSRRR